MELIWYLLITRINPYYMWSIMKNWQSWMNGPLNLVSIFHDLQHTFLIQCNYLSLCLFWIGIQVCMHLLDFFVIFVLQLYLLLYYGAILHHDVKCAQLYPIVVPFMIFIIDLISLTWVLIEHHLLLFSTLFFPFVSNTPFQMLWRMFFPFR